MDNESSGTNSEKQPGLVTLDDLRAVDVNRLLDGQDVSDDHELRKPFYDVAEHAAGQNDERQHDACRLLGNLCGIHLRVDDPAEPFGPLLIIGDQRSSTASDFAGKQTEVLAEFAVEVAHPVLRARIADVAWYNDRSKGDSGKLAIDAYCEIIARRLAGDLHNVHGDDNRLLDLVDYMLRALQVAARVYKAGALPDHVQHTFGDVIEQAVAAQQYVAFCSLAEAGLGYGLLDWEKVATDADRIIASESDDRYTQAIKGVWELAARAYRRLDDDENQKRCEKHVVLQDLKMRDQVDSNVAKAHWTRMAIGELRQFGGFQEWIDELRQDLRKLEEASLDEFVPQSFTMDVKDELLETIERFKKLSLSDALREFAQLNAPLRREDIKKYVDETGAKFPLASLFGQSFSDRDGKVTAQSEARPIDGEPDDEWYKAQSLTYLELHRRYSTSARIEPARQTLLDRIALEQRHFVPIVQHSPFVQPGYQHIFSLGFARFWQGDYASAAYLLIPQLENAIRYVLSNANEQTAKIMSDLTQDDLSLSGLFLKMREPIERIFAPDLAHEIDMLFNFRPGPALRHELAHGKLNDGHCYGSDTIYACWQIYQLTCLPLMPQWEDVIASAIEAQTL